MVVLGDILMKRILLAITMVCGVFGFQKMFSAAKSDKKPDYLPLKMVPVYGNPWVVMRVEMPLKYKKGESVEDRRYREYRYYMCSRYKDALAHWLSTGKTLENPKQPVTEKLVDEFLRRAYMEEISKRAETYKNLPSRSLKCSVRNNPAIRECEDLSNRPLGQFRNVFLSSRL